MRLLSLLSRYHLFPEACQDLMVPPLCDHPITASYCVQVSLLATCHPPHSRRHLPLMADCPHCWRMCPGGTGGRQWHEGQSRAEASLMCPPSWTHR